MTTPLDIATGYYARGWVPIEVLFRSKKAHGDNWPQRRYESAEDLKRYFNCAPQNVGILVGEASHWLIDIDLDCGEAIRLAPHFLPATPLRFGRKSKPCSHWLYTAPGAHTEKFVDNFGADGLVVPRGGRGQMLVELRSTGGQTVFPGSVHESGELVEFDGDSSAQAATVVARDLRDAVARLAAATILVRHGWRDGDAVSAVRGEHPAADRLLGVETFDDAAERYNSDRAREWPKSGGECPMCGHKDCFGSLPDNRARWSCFSSSHTEPGLVARDGSHHGDVLDVEAHAAGISRQEMLRREGYLSGPIEAKARGWLGIESKSHASAPKPKADAKPRQDQAPSVASDGRLEIRYSPDDFHGAVRLTVEALAAHPNVFRRGQELVCVIDHATAKVDSVSRDADAKVIAQIGLPKLAEVTSEVSTWLQRSSEGEWRRREPKRDVVAAVHSRGMWPGIRTLNGITTCPVMRPDGSILDAPGYDRETGLVYKPSITIDRVADKPSMDEVVAAKDALLDLVVDFPFVGEEHRSAWLAAALTPLALPAVELVPLMLVDSASRGSGKTMLSEIISLIATGLPIPKESPPKGKDADEEMSKRIVAHALAGDTLILIDNAKNGSTIGWSSLDSAITAGIVSGRRLGSSEILRLPFRACWHVNGNNLAISEDMARRCLHLRLVAEDEHPEKRTGFRHPDLIGHVRRERARLLLAGLTLLRAYVAAGRPAQPGPAMGSFESWSSLVRGCCQWLGMADPLGTWATDDAQLDPRAAAHTQLLESWGEIDPSGEGLKAADVLRRIKVGAIESAKDALSELCRAGDNGLPSPADLGRCFRAMRDVRRGSLVLRNELDRKGIALWKVERVA